MIKYFLKNYFLWIRIILPLLLALLLFWFLTSMIYYDRKHRYISSFWDDYWLEFSLKLAGFPNQKDINNLIIISLTDDDLNKFKSSGSLLRKDVHIDVYISLLEKLLAENPKFIVLYWDSTAHESQLTYYKRFLLQFKKALVEQKLLLVSSKLKSTLLPLLSDGNVPVFLDINCKENTQIICPYDKKADTWVVQKLFDLLITDTNITESSWILSDNLTLPFKSYVLMLSDYNHIPHFSFSSILNDIHKSKLFTNSIIFIGQNLTQGEYIDMSQYVQIALPFRSQLSQYIPKHIFWAQLSQMFLNKNFIQVLPWSFNLMLCILVCIIILISLAYLGSILTLLCFLLFILLSPVFNALLIKIFYLYVPLFNIFYAGLSALLFSAFGFISYEMFQSWRVEEKRKSINFSKEIKQNFISLITHNLNTPIAKMYGLVELILNKIKQNPQLSSYRVLFDDLLSLIIKQQMLIKFVLNLNVFQDKSFNLENIQIKFLLKDFEENFLIFLKKSGIIISSISVPEEELLYYSIDCDKRVFNTSLLAYLYFFCDIFKSNSIQITFRLNESRLQDQNFIIFILEIYFVNFNETSDFSDINEFLNSLKGEGLTSRDLKDIRFFVNNFWYQILFEQIKNLIVLYDGNILYKPSESAVIFKLNLNTQE